MTKRSQLTVAFLGPHQVAGRPYQGLEDAA
jgi:hypothetical protein